MDKKPIQLTEQDLHMLVEDAVRVYLKENGMDEGAWSALWGAGKQAVGNKFAQAKQGIQNLGQNIQNTAQAGRNLSMMQKHKANIENSLNAIKVLDPQDLEVPIEQLKQQLDMTLKKVQGRLQTAQQRTFSTQNYSQQ